MILAIDVDYKNDGACIAGLVINHWEDEDEQSIFLSYADEVADYESGSFYRRELPCILSLIKEHSLKPSTIVVDGFVWLNGVDKPGLGAHLFHALNDSVSVIGVAKRPFKDIPKQCELLRGDSKKPLYITSVGIELEQAKINVLNMAGKNRMPTLLKKVDRLCREG